MRKLFAAFALAWAFFGLLWAATILLPAPTLAIEEEFQRKLKGRGRT